MDKRAIAVVLMFAALFAPSMVAAVIDVTNVTSDINSALTIFWLIPQSLVDHFGVIITLIMLGALISLIGVIINFLKTLLTNSLEKYNV